MDSQAYHEAKGRVAFFKIQLEMCAQRIEYFKQRGNEKVVASEMEQLKSFKDSYDRACEEFQKYGNHE